VCCVGGCGLVGGVAEVDGEEDEAGEGGRGWECKHPAREEGDSVADRLRRRLERWRLCEVDDGAAVGADGEMGEGCLLLVERQGVLGEGVELVRVGMLAGLEVRGHVVAGGWLAAGSRSGITGCARVV
jgi:hypothetical protein